MAVPLLLGALVVVAAWSMAALAMVNAQGASAARRVALLLFILGADVATSAIGFPLILPPREWAAAITVHFMLDMAVPPLTLLFMARALDTPVARVLRGRTAELALGALALAGPAVAWVAVHRMPDRAFVPYLFSYIALGFLAGFLLALHGWRSAEGSERRRAGMFATAFGILDVAWAIAFGGVAFSGSDPSGALQLAYGGGALVFALVLGYAILQHRLLGIDVKIRWAISKSTLAAIFVAVFFVASELAQQFFDATLGGAYAGIIAAGALVFALAPLQRAAERLAEKAVPVVAQPSRSAPTARAEDGGVQRREAAYRKAARWAMRDRRITREEEVHLHELAFQLDIDGRRAHEIMVEVEREEAVPP